MLQHPETAPRLVTSAPTNSRAFTLLELLVVIAILGILAALTVPVLKNFGKSDATLSASRQLLDGVARARQMAISHRTTVYMVFVPTNFWVDTSGTFPNLGGWWGHLPPALQNTVTNLADQQLSGYNFVANGAMGDQPGQHALALSRPVAEPAGGHVHRPEKIHPIHQPAPFRDHRPD